MRSAMIGRNFSIAKEKARRRYNEGCVGTLLLVAIELSLVFGFLFRNRGTFRSALDQMGLLEEWAALCGSVAILLVAGLIWPRVRQSSLAFAAIVNGATATMLFFFAPGLVLAPYGLVVQFATVASCALLWLHVRGEVYSTERKNARKD